MSTVHDRLHQQVQKIHEETEQKIKEVTDAADANVKTFLYEFLEEVRRQQPPASQQTPPLSLPELDNPNVA